MKVFLSYSRVDEEFKNALLIHLKPLVRMGKFDIWDDRLIVPGEEWNIEIKGKLMKSEIILLLLSPTALASDFIYEHEMKFALEQHSLGNKIVVPIIVKPCIWKYLEVAKIQALPKNGTPISEWVNQDLAYLDIVNGLNSITVKDN